MKIDPKYVFLHAFFFFFVSCPFQNLSIWPKTYPFSNFARFCTPKRCTRVNCLVLKNNPNYVYFFTRMISNFKYKWPPGLKLNKYICFELNRAYQERKTHIGSLEVVKNPWIWKIYIYTEIRLRRGFYYISFADVLVVTEQQAGSMRI